MSSLSRGTGLGPHWLPAAASHPIPSHPILMTWTNWLTSVTQSRLSFQDSNLIWDCPGLKNIIIWPQAELHSSTRQSSLSSLLSKFLLLTFCLSPCWWNLVQVPPSPASGAKYVPRCAICFFAHLSITPPGSCCYAPSADWDIPLLRVGHFFVTGHYFVLGNGDQKLLYPMLDRLHLHVSMWTSIAFRECNPITEKSHIHIPSLSSFFLLLFVAGHSPVWPREIVFPVFGYLCCVVGESDCHSLHMTQLSYSVYIL